jgi:hypothetical protein
MKRKQYLIYALTDPRTGEIRYVGKSEHGLARPRAHDCPSNRTNTYCSRWIAKLKAQGITYGIQVLEELSARDLLSEAEERWIAKLRAEGCKLTNLTNGGGGTKGRSWTEEQRRRQSERCKGVPLSLEQREKLRIANTGKKASAETKAKMSATRKGRTISEAHRKALSESLKGHPVSAEAREKMAAAKRGKKQEPEVVAARAQRMKGHIVTAETRARISEAKRRSNAAKRAKQVEPGHSP